MFIPAPAQDLQLPLTQKLEATPVVPVTAVPGVAEDAKSLDSRVALQWAQPVFAGEKGQAGRSALAPSVPEALVQTPKSVVPGYEPQGADPDALQSGNVHPLLAQGLSTWLSGVLAKQNGSSAITDLIPLRVNVKGQTNAKSNDATMSDSSELKKNLQNIYQSIANHDIFAAQKLHEAWMSKHDTSFQEPSTAQLIQWVSALEPDSDAAEQAARMLTQGTMVWQTELVNGVPMRIVREDAWRNNPLEVGQLEKGATLKVQVTLPNLGMLRILGSQWGQDISLQILHGTPETNGQVNWAVLAPQLLQELRTQGLTDVRVDSMPDEAMESVRQESPNV